ncbi:hypothetical protein OY671_006763 [Metschnikowia pulcherrima]|nr:hypothetical protein OY671_006763 [Metschnikowia pulcherrima]
MVSFSCEVCNDTVIKKKLDQHKQRCYDAYFTCIDCSTTFGGNDYRNHTQCISEAEKYEKSLYRGKPSQKNNAAKAKPEKKESKPVEPVKDAKKETVEKVKKEKKAKKAKSPDLDLSKYTGDSLSKVLKSMSKDTKTEKKDLLKKLRLELVDGKVVLTL